MDSDITGSAPFNIDDMIKPLLFLTTSLILQVLIVSTDCQSLGVLILE